MQKYIVEEVEIEPQSSLIKIQLLTLLLFSLKREKRSSDGKQTLHQNKLLTLNIIFSNKSILEHPTVLTKQRLKWHVGPTWIIPDYRLRDEKDWEWVVAHVCAKSATSLAVGFLFLVVVPTYSIKGCFKIQFSVKQESTLINLWRLVSDRGLDWSHRAHKNLTDHIIFWYTKIVPITLRTTKDTCRSWWMVMDYDLDIRINREIPISLS